MRKFPGGNHYFDNDQMNALSMAASNEYRKRHGLLTSSEIEGYRKRLGMTQQEFAGFLKVGIASIKRWEGVAIQDAAMDQLIRISCDPKAQEEAAWNLGEHLAQEELITNIRSPRQLQRHRQSEK